MSSPEIERLRREVARGGSAEVVARLLMKLQREGEVDREVLESLAHGLECWNVVESRNEPSGWSNVEVRTFLSRRLALRAGLATIRRLEPEVGVPEFRRLVREAEETLDRAPPGRVPLIVDRAFDYWNERIRHDVMVHVRKGRIE